MIAPGYNCARHEFFNASTPCTDCAAPVKENILQEADRITSGDRRKEYGSPKENFGRIAKMWSVVLGVEVSPLQVSLCMILLKVCRELNGHKRDSLVDIAGYARTAEMLMDGE